MSLLWDDLKRTFGPALHGLLTLIGYSFSLYFIAHMLHRVWHLAWGSPRHGGKEE